MSTIYIVASGDYSDYRINGVFSTRALAEEFKTLAQADEIEEHELDVMPDRPPGHLFFIVRMDKKGNTSYVGLYSCIKEGRFMDIGWEPSMSVGYVNYFLWATDEKHAVKIANEKRVSLIADNLWEAASDWRAYQKYHYERAEAKEDQ